MPCTEDEYKDAVVRNAQYARAEAVYRNYLIKYVRAMRAGGARELAPSLRATIGDPTFAKSTLAQLRQFKSEGVHVAGADPEVVAVIRRPAAAMNGSTIAMQFCVDARSLVVYRGKKRVNQLRISHDTVFFRARATNDLVIVAGTFENVESCAG